MKWLLIVAGGLLAVVVLVFLVGALLPREHVAGSAVMIRQPRDTVWRTVRDLAAVPAWWREVASSQRSADSAGREVWEQKLKNGFTLRLIVTAETPPGRLLTTIDAPADAPFGGTWTYELTDVDGGTRVVVTERGYINNPLFRFMSRFLFGYHATQEGYLRALGAKLGEPVEPQRVP